jgi:hypothetical protein
MDLERLFSAANMLVLPGWLLLVLLPRWRFTTGLVASVVLPGLLSIAYAVIAARAFGSGAADFSAFGSLAGVKGLFQDDALLLAGWIHYLAFDLFIGSWEVRDARRLGIHHLLVVPCLAFTFMLGPVGLLAYLLLRLAARGQWMIDEAASVRVAG